jgi:hypothetical protein
VHQACQFLFVCLSADVDPDANIPRRGRTDAISAHQGDTVCLDASRQGLDVLAGVLEELSLPCTLFWEARTLQTLAAASPQTIRRFLDNGLLEHGCHGLKHEDFAGKDSGLPINAEETARILRQATDIVAAVTGARPAGFRAPYCRLTPELTAALSEAGYLYDSTLTRTPGQDWTMRPCPLDPGPTDKPVWELAICRARDGRGKPITSYLWQMFEGRRPTEDYVSLVSSLRGPYQGGLFQLALHPWHMVVDETGKRIPRDTERELRTVLTDISRLDGVKFITAGEYLRCFISQQAGRALA